MITKYTNCEIIEVKSADEKIEGNSKLASFDHIPQDTYRTNDGYLYVKVRAISSRVNKNFDGWPVNELAGMEEEDFNKLASELIRSDEFFEKDSATSSDKEVKKFLKTIKNELGFLNAREGKHFRIWHPSGNPGNKATIAGTPTNWKAAVEETSKELATRYPQQWGYYRYLNRYPSVKHLQRAHGQLGENENPLDELRVASFEDENKTLTFTKDSSLKTKGDFGFKTFIGRPIFIDHNNSDPQRARGVIVDAMLHVEPPTKTSSDSYWATAPDNHKPETWIELLLEVDGKAFPKLANALIEGKVNAVSMGCNVEYTVCSVCNHEADNIDEYCDHIKKKGTTFKTGNVSKLAYEDCYNINFFEISAVFDPADVTALFTEPVKTASVQKKAEEDFKGINPESKQVETKISSVKIGDSITAPDKVDTLKSEKPCPIGLAGECGLDDESGRCEKCGYREPPKPLDDPDLSKARAFDRQKEEEVEKSNDETKDLIDQLKRTLSKNEKRSVNSKMNDNTKITLTANVEEVPSDSKLAELGWIIPEKEAGAASNTVPVTEDGEAVSDRPKEQRVISDQIKPVESTTKVALGELPGLAQPSGGESTPQYKGDKNNETSGISEHNPSEMAEQYQSVKRPVEEPQFAGEGYTQDIKQHNPSDTAEQYQKVKKEEEKPQFADEGGTSGITQHQPGGKQSHESSILSAIKLADLEVELGLNDAEMKYARVAELEDEDPAIVNAKYETLSKIKEAGLTKKEAGSSKKLASFPSMKGTKEASVTSSSTGSVPDDAIFN